MTHLAISVSLVSLDFMSSSPAMASLMVVAILAEASPIRASRWTSEVRARPRDWSLTIYSVRLFNFDKLSC